MLFGFSFWGHKFVENFSGVIGALKSSTQFFNLMQNALDFIQTWTKLPFSLMPVRARENVYFFLTNNDRRQLFCYKPVICYQCVE